MKQLIQSYRTGKLGLFDVPVPLCNEKGILINTTASLISAGTEKMIIDIAKKSLVGKAKARPDLVRQVVDKMKQEGIRSTLDKVFTKLDAPIPLGYSCAGKVIETGQSIKGISVGDRVACGGAGYANHSEINYVPKNLFVKIPDEVDDEDASFVTVGSIALQGIRQTEPAIGEKIVVLGMGLIGLLTVQLLKANGCSILGVDVDEFKLSLGDKLGAGEVCPSSELIETAKRFTNGYGADAVIITASTQDSSLINMAGEISRFKGRIVVVGLVGMNIPRDIYYKKELEVKLSMAYGPGRYDPQYEEQGIDYPYSYVRWTEQRNFEAFLNLIKQKRITPKDLITHRFNFEQALNAYDLLNGKIKEKYIGIVLNYVTDTVTSDKREKIYLHEPGSADNEKIRLGLIGAGSFAKSVTLPILKKVDKFKLSAICDSSPVAVRSTGKKYGFEYITSDPEDLFGDNMLQAIIANTPHNDHANKIIKSIKNNKHIFVEKPLCISREELDRINTSYEEAGTKPVIQVGFNRRFSPIIQKMRDQIVGLPVSINYRVNAGIVPMDHWIQDQKIGGGRIIGEVCHFIDTLSYLIDSQPASLSATVIKKADNTVPDEDNVNILINYENGSTAHIAYYAYGNKQLPKEYIEVFGPNISIQMFNFRKLIIYKGGKKVKISNANQDKGFKNEFSAFAASVKSGIPAISFESLYITTLATFKILEAIPSGKRLSID